MILSVDISLTDIVSDLRNGYELTEHQLNLLGYYANTISIKVINNMLGGKFKIIRNYDNIYLKINN